MIPIPDDPIISAMERTGYPPWWDFCEPEDNDDEEEDQNADELL